MVYHEINHMLIRSITCDQNKNNSSNDDNSNDNNIKNNCPVLHYPKENNYPPNFMSFNRRLSRRELDSLVSMVNDDVPSNI